MHKSTQAGETFFVVDTTDITRSLPPSSSITVAGVVSAR